jgi:predicted metal-dependent hydrolase
MRTLSRGLNKFSRVLKINGSRLRYNVEYRNVKYPRLEFKTGNLLVILPHNIDDERDLLYKKSEWIYKKHKRIEEALKNSNITINKNNIIIFGQKFNFIKHNNEEPIIDFGNKIVGINRRNKNHIKRVRNLLKSQLLNIINSAIEDYGSKLNVKPNKVHIRKQKNKWASCSSDGTLRFNSRLIFLPENLIRYVTFHEMIHIKQPRHNNNFWDFMKDEFKEPEKLERQLLEYWFITHKYNKILSKIV